MTQKTYTAADLRERLRATIAAKPYYNVQSRWANAHGIRHAAVSDFLHGGKPTAKIVAALGYEVECYYVEKG